MQMIWQKDKVKTESIYTLEVTREEETSEELSAAKNNQEIRDSGNRKWNTQHGGKHNFK